MGEEEGQENRDQVIGTVRVVEPREFLLVAVNVLSVKNLSQVNFLNEKYFSKSRNELFVTLF